MLAPIISYKKGRLIKRIQKYPAFNHNREFLGWYSTIEELKKVMKKQNSQILVTNLVVTKYLGFKEDIGFLKQFIIFPIELKMIS